MWFYPIPYRRGGETFESLRKVVGVKDVGTEISGPGSAVRLASTARGDLSRGLRQGGRDDDRRARALGVRLLEAEPKEGEHIQITDNRSLSQTTSNATTPLSNCSRRAGKKGGEERKREREKE